MYRVNKSENSKAVSSSLPFTKRITDSNKKEKAMKTNISLKHLKFISKFSFPIVITIILAMMLTTSTHAQINVLHNFGGGTNDGAAPLYSAPIIYDGHLYGMTADGGYYEGLSGIGVIYRIGIDGTGYMNIHNFEGWPGEGSKPEGSLIRDGKTLYGMTSKGGVGLGGGLIFKMKIDGSDYTNLYFFEVYGSDGKNPRGDLTLADNVLYGMTQVGGQGSGVVFRINTDGTGYKNLHVFLGLPNDGARPYGSLIYSDGLLYGMTHSGGSNDMGIIFSINTNGADYTTLYILGNGTDGARPYGKLVIAGNTLYGLTQGGGDTWDGALFKIKTDGTDYINLHSFSSSSSDGAYPYGSLTLWGSTLYGMTSYAGLSNGGMVFRYKLGQTMGGKYKVLGFFEGANGYTPMGSIGKSGNTLYGMTHAGGLNNLGVIFSLAIDESFVQHHSFTGGADSGKSPWSTDPVIGYTAMSGMTKGNGLSMYGMTKEGGISNKGVVFSMNLDGSNYSNIYAFIGGNVDGSNPLGSLVLSNNTLYGLTKYGGSNDCGSAFKINTDGTGYSILHEFSFDPLDGANPCGSLTLYDNAFYGTTLQGGAGNSGTVFRLNADGTEFTNLHAFTGGTTDGSSPFGNVVFSDGKFYGMSFSGGSNDKGVVFKMNSDGSDFSLLHNFAGGTDDGASPFGSLTVSGNTLYGMTRNGGTGDKGVVFKISTDGTGYSNLHVFTGGSEDGSMPYGNLILWGNSLYGMTSEGGLSDLGCVFEMNTDGTGFQLINSFSGGEDGASPHGGLVLWGSELLGLTTYGGADNCGTMFSYVIPEPLICLSFGGFCLAVLFARRRNL